MRLNATGAGATKEARHRLPDCHLLPVGQRPCRTPARPRTRSAACSGSCLLGAAVAAAVAAAPAVAQGQAMPEILVIDRAMPDDGYEVTRLDSYLGPDVTSMLQVVPGAAVNSNGPLSLQAQYRGMFGPRVNVTVDGLSVLTGGPNWMDPPLHYLPAGLVGSVTVHRGITSVTDGSAIGGAVEARALRAGHGDSSEWGLQGRVGAGGATANDSSDVYGLVSFANARHRLQVMGAMEQGGDAEFAGGTVAASGYGRSTYGAGYSLRLGEGDEVAVDYQRTDTNNAGTPALPLDIAFFETDLTTLRANFTPGSLTVRSRLRLMNISHGMNNFELRDPPDFSQLPLPPFQGVERRAIAVVGRGLSWYVSAEQTFGDGVLTFGSDGSREQHDATVTDPDVPPFFVDNFNDAARNSSALFAQWDQRIGERLGLEVGMRYERVAMEAGPVDAQPAQLVDAGMAGMGTPPFAVWTLRNRFNDGDRSVQDDNVELVLKTDYQVTDELGVEVGLARRVRSPTYVERFLWIPLEINSGLSDLNTYVGDVGLSPETSWQLELGAAWRRSGFYLAPRAFLRRVDDFIQGMPTDDQFVVAVSGNANGDPTPMQFTNVDARFYGFDVAFGAAVTRRLRFDGTVGYVRGERRDIADDLFRIAPLNGRLALQYATRQWSAGVDLTAFATQERISSVLVLGEPRSDNGAVPGYALVGVNGRWESPRSGLSVAVGVDNLLDQEFAPATAGFNKVINSDLAVGQQVPGLGRNVWARVRWEFGGIGAGR